MTSTQSILIDTDHGEYCRYHDSLDVVTAYLAFTGAEAGDVVTINLIRMDGYGALAMLTQTVTCAAGQPSATVTFALADAVEQPSYPSPAFAEIPVYRAVAGDYQVQATATGMTGTAASATFAVSVVPVDELRSMWIRGVPLQALDVLGPLQQPQVLTGVRIRRVSEGCERGVHTLAYTTGSPGTLAWDGGAAVAVPATRGQVALVAQDGESYVLCEVAPFLLPAKGATENIIVEGGEFDDDSLRRYVHYATGELESAFYFFLEPRNSDTDPALNATRFGYFIDRAEQPVTYKRPRDFAHWMSFQLQRRRILKVYHLDGWFNQSQAVSIGRDWIVFDEVTGTLELVPDNGAIISWQFYGAAILQFFINYDTIPSFWHFGMASGIPDLTGDYAVLRQAIAKKAASDILSAAGFAYTAGAASRSVSRDGVSDSRTYAGKQGGEALRSQYEEWLKQMIPRLRTRYGGIQMQTV